MNTAVGGAARVVFGADSSEFDATARGVEGVLGRLVERFHDVERRIKAVGTGMTLGITVPFAAMTRTVDKTAGGFEAQMKRVEAAVTDISHDQLDALSDAARELGPKVGKGATEAAGAIEALGLAGVSASDILGGALKASLDLATAGMVDAESSSALVTDVMGQFRKSAADLPGVVTNVVGALDASKMGFDDFRLAIGQGGAIAASAGVSFLDFSTSIAATSTQFASGADAGTSFKTYIQSLVPKSKEAERAMAKLGLSFFETDGRMKPMAEQAEMLRVALGKLSDKSRNEALNAIFGADAARTAIGLMEQGRKGFEQFQATVAGGDVEAKIAKRMEGSAAASARIANAWESVKIAIGLEGGLLAPLTAIKNAFARVLEAVAHAPPIFLKVGAVFSALAAAMGPLIVAVAHVGAAIIANFAAAKFGVIGRVLGLIISPVSTIISMLGEYGLARVLSMVASRLLAMMGPIGWAVSAFLLFKDHIIAALSAVWTEITTTLGPPVEAIIAKFQAMFAKLSGGPVGGAIEGLISMLSSLKDFIGNGLAMGILVAGEIIERTLGVIVAAIGGLVDVVSGVIDVISALLTGDFAGAWEAVVGIVESVFDAIVAMAAAIVPELGGELAQVYNAAKQWLADGFAQIGTWCSQAVQAMVNYVAQAFPGVVTAAQAVYTGVKAWLVDAFGGVIDWVRGAVKEVVSWYDWMAQKIGRDTLKVGAPAAANPPKPADPKPAPASPGGSANVSFDEPKKERTKKGGREKKGRDAAADAADRAQMATQNELEAARLRGDREAEDAIRRRLDLQRQVEAYQRTGLSLAAATAAATKDMAALDAARRVGLAQDLERDGERHAIEVARVSGNRTLEETLQRQRDLNDAIRGFQRDGLSLTEATIRAQRQQLELDQARAAVRARLIADEKQDRELELARTRGDSEGHIRQLQREIDIRNRARELEREQQMDPDAAQRQAALEWGEMEKARQTGVFRDTFKQGVRAALDGDLKGWLSNWWKERMQKGMEEALNNLADAVAKLFEGIGKGADGGGIGGLLGQVFGAVFGKPSATPTGGTPGIAGPKVPGFKNGGSFRVGGRSGIDANLVAFRATRGEMVDIRHGNDNGPSGGPMVVELVVGEGQMFEPRVTGISGNVTTRTVRANNARSAMARRQTLA